MEYEQEFYIDPNGKLIDVWGEPVEAKTHQQEGAKEPCQQKPAPQ